MRAMRCFMTVCPPHDWRDRLFLPSRRVGLSTKRILRPRIKHHHVFLFLPTCQYRQNSLPNLETWLFFRTPMYYKPAVLCCAVIAYETFIDHMVGLYIYCILFTYRASKSVILLRITWIYYGALTWYSFFLFTSYQILWQHWRRSSEHWRGWHQSQHGRQLEKSHQKDEQEQHTWLQLQQHSLQ